MRKAFPALRAGTVLLAAFLASPALAALTVSGVVRDEAGKPVPHVRITIAEPTMVPATVSVFSVADGTFSAPAVEASADAATISSFRIGWEEANRKVTTGGDALNLEITLKHKENVADQVPASAWIPGQPGERAFHIAIHECGGCHQLASERMKNFSRTLEGAPLDARRGAWEAMVQFMRVTSLHMGPSGEWHLRWGLTEDSPDYKMALTPETSFFMPNDMDIVVPYLAENFPTSFDTYKDYDDVARLGEFGTNRNTVVEEYQLPTFGWTREVSIAPGSPLLWFLELDADRLGSLDPKTGKVAWYDIPGEGPQGPHTLNADAEGNLWVALEESYSIGRFDPKTLEWKVYPPPPDVKFAITHDTAFDSKRQIVTDTKGRIWLTLVGLNELWGVDTATGEITRAAMPLPEGEQTFHVFIYGSIMDPRRNRVWWTQLNGYLGSLNTDTLKVETLVPFPDGAAPRRMAMEENGTLWVPLYGEGQIIKFDTVAGKELARYDMPDRAGASYSLTLDEKRHALWVGTTNSDRIYRFDIDTEKWSHYPMPRKEAFLRMIEVDHETGDIWTAYANLPVGKRDPAIYGKGNEGSNNMVVRLQPGD